LHSPVSDSVHRKTEVQDERGNIKGEVIVSLPDGRIQTTNYRAEFYTGFTADVRYVENNPKHQHQTSQHVNRVVKQSTLHPNTLRLLRAKPITPEYQDSKGLYPVFTHFPVQNTGTVRPRIKNTGKSNTIKKPTQISLSQRKPKGFKDFGLVVKNSLDIENKDQNTQYQYKRIKEEKTKDSNLKTDVISDTLVKRKKGNFQTKKTTRERVIRFLMKVQEMKKKENELINSNIELNTNKPLTPRVAKFLKKLKILKLEKTNASTPIMPVESRHIKENYVDHQVEQLKIYPHIIPLQHFDFEF